MPTDRTISSFFPVAPPLPPFQPKNFATHFQIPFPMQANSLMIAVVRTRDLQYGQDKAEHSSTRRVEIMGVLPLLA